jgi:hypothetical protein
MIEQNEIVMLLLGIGLLIFTMKNRPGLRQLPESRILCVALYALIGSFFASVLEGFFWNPFFNSLEHAGLAISSVLTAVWSWKVFIGKKEAR